MANPIVIVTNKCYLIAEAINYITIDEVEKEKEDIFSSKSRRKRTKTAKALAKKKREELSFYEITVDYVPAQAGSNVNNRRDLSSVAITVQGLINARTLFSDMVGQIREQLPDHLFLDKLVQRFLAETVGS